MSSGDGGYLDNFGNDVFISYAHVENLPDREGDKGWVEEFGNQLSVRLLKRLGVSVKVWRDPKLSRAQVVDRVIEKEVLGSGVLLSLITPRYLHSDYCAQEIDWFRDKAQSEPPGLVVGDDYLRVLPVLLYNIPRDDWPEVCREVTPFEFFETAEDEFGEPLSPDSPEFGRSLARLVKSIVEILGHLQASTPAEPAALPPRQESEESDETVRVFLARSPDRLVLTRQRLSDALARQGIEILSPVPPPYGREEHDQAVTEAVRSATLSVHLLGEDPGEPMEGGTTYTVEQVRLGLESARSQLVLLPQGLESERIQDPGYAEFITQLENRKRDPEKFELVNASRSQVVDETLGRLEWLRERDQQKRRLAAIEAGAAEKALIDVHEEDLDSAASLVQYLAQQRITPIMIPSVGSPGDGVARFQEKMTEAELFILFYGSVARSWVVKRLEAAIKRILTQQLATRILVYIGPPHKEAVQLQFPVDVALNMESFDPESLAPILAKTSGPV